MSELVDIFLKHKGFKKERGSCNAPLIPNILADSLYLCWEEYIKNKLNKESKMHANKMMASYSLFNKDFFKGFEKEQTAICVDAMDWFYDYTKEELDAFRSAFKNVFKAEKDEVQVMVSNIAVCKLLASHANEIWGIIYKTAYGKSHRDSNLYGMYHASRELFNVYVRDNIRCKPEIADLSNDEDINRAMKRFESKVMDFVNEWR